MLNNSKQAEQERVNYVQEQIKTQLVETKEALEKATTERRKVESSYGDTAKVNLAEIDDRMETNAAIQQQKQLVALAFENETILTNRQKHLNLLDGSPYFGRIDIAEDSELEPLYIGTSSLIKDDDFLVYDWRAPISALYYNGTLGQASYETPVGDVSVDLVNKRQFEIVDGHIKKMFDTNETIGDSVLQDVLSSSSDLYMKNIVATIQQQQNEIIRNTKSNLLVVQGVAGSGKTSAILQRIAFLLYHSRTKLNSDQIILFSPNNLFSNYISQVLPSLGEQNMRQVTLADFLGNRHQGFKIESLFSRFDRDQTSLPKPTLDIRNYFESLDFVHEINNYLAKTPSADLPFVDLYLDGKIVINADEIKAIYQQIPNTYPLAERFRQTKQALLHLLRKKEAALAKTPEIETAVENLSDTEYHALIANEKKFSDYDHEFNFLAKKLAYKNLTSIHQAIINDLFIDIYQAYLNLLNQLEAKDLNQAALKEIIHQTENEIELHQLRLTDAVGIMYLRDLLTGSGQNFNIKHIFIDEMQDYSPALLSYLSHSFPKAKFTLLGDFAQDIFSMTKIQNTQDQQAQLSTIFNQQKMSFNVLNTSYRSTKAITDFAKALIKNDSIQSFQRDGQKPILYEFNDLSKLVPLYLKVIKEQLAKYQIVALVTKNQAQADEMAEILKGQVEYTLITEKTRTLAHGLLILPIYLAKGLEFDAVMAHNISAENYELPNVEDNVYTISTRAMHQLTLTSFGKPVDVIKNIDSNLFDYQEI